MKRYTTIRAHEKTKMLLARLGQGSYDNRIERLCKIQLALRSKTFTELLESEYNKTHTIDKELIVKCLNKMMEK